MKRRTKLAILAAVIIAAAWVGMAGQDGMRLLLIAAVLAVACVTVTGCSVAAPRVAAAQEQARISKALDRMSDELARQNAALERIATALESAQP